MISARTFDALHKVHVGKFPFHAERFLEQLCFYDLTPRIKGYLWTCPMLRLSSPNREISLLC